MSLLYQVRKSSSRRFEGRPTPSTMVRVVTYSLPVLILATLVPLPRCLGFHPHLQLQLPRHQPTAPSFARRTGDSRKRGAHVLNSTPRSSSSAVSAWGRFGDTIRGGRGGGGASGSATLLPLREAKNFKAVLSRNVRLRYVALLVFLSWAPVRVARVMFNRYVTNAPDEDEYADPEARRGWTTMERIRWSLLPPAFRKKMDFEDSPFYHGAAFVSEAARIGTVTCLVDCAVNVLREYYGLALKQYKPRIFAGISYTAWGALRLSQFKRYVLCRVLKTTSDKLGKGAVADRLMDGIIYVVSALGIIDVLQIPIGMALSSIFAFGGVGTLAFTLASKDLASQLVGSMALAATDTFRAGDSVRFGDGTSGKVEKIGWMHTFLRGSDEVTIRIPNAQLQSQRVSNLSRVQRCQVKQTLRFHYEDAEKIPTFLTDLKREVATTCPRLITDGTRPCRAHLRDFQEDHLSAVVDFHFNISPNGDMYYDNRQRVLEAVTRVAKRNGLWFAVPTTMSLRPTDREYVPDGAGASLPQLNVPNDATLRLQRVPNVDDESAY